MKMLEYRNRFFDYYFLVVYTEVIALYCNTSLCWEEEKDTKCWLLIQGLTVAKQVS